jgi:hypothetical protein
MAPPVETLHEHSADPASPPGKKARYSALAKRCDFYKLADLPAYLWPEKDRFELDNAMRLTRDGVLVPSDMHSSSHEACSDHGSSTVVSDSDSQAVPDTDAETEAETDAGTEADSEGQQVYEDAAVDGEYTCADCGFDFGSEHHGQCPVCNDHYSGMGGGGAYSTEGSDGGDEGSDGGDEGSDGGDEGSDDPDMFTCERCGNRFRMGPQCDCYQFWEDGQEDGQGGAAEDSFDSGPGGLGAVLAPESAPSSPAPERADSGVVVPETPPRT